MSLDYHNPFGYVIRISEQAFIQMCLAGLEAYSVSHRDNPGHKTGLETYGLLFGHEVEMSNKQTLYSVELATVDTSAWRTRTGVTPNMSALNLKRDFMTSFFPQHDFLGNFHSHPYAASYREIVKGNWHTLSPTDREHVEGDSSDYLARHGYRIAIVLTVTLLEKIDKKKHKPLDSSTVAFTLGNYRLLLKAYATSFDDAEECMAIVKDDEIRLDCPAVLGMVEEYTEFGKGRCRGRMSHACGKIYRC